MTRGGSKKILLFYPRFRQAGFLPARSACLLRNANLCVSQLNRFGKNHIFARNLHVMARKTQLADIAKKPGVSKTLVSCVINSKSDFQHCIRTYLHRQRSHEWIFAGLGRCRHFTYN